MKMPTLSDGYYLGLHNSLRPKLFQYVKGSYRDGEGNDISWNPEREGYSLISLEKIKNWQEVEDLNNCGGG